MLINSDSAPKEINTSALATSANLMPIDIVEKLLIITPPEPQPLAGGSTLQWSYPRPGVWPAAPGERSSKQLHFAAHLDVQQAAAVILFACEHRRVMQLTQLPYQYAP